MNFAFGSRSASLSYCPVNELKTDVPTSNKFEPGVTSLPPGSAEPEAVIAASGFFMSAISQSFVCRLMRALRIFFAFAKAGFYHGTETPPTGHPW